MAFNYLPGVQVATVDNGLAARNVPSSKATLVLGTSGIGPADNPYTVFDRAVSAKAFGTSGTLIRAQEELALGGNDNIILYRMGTTPATLAGVGQSYGTALTISNTARTGTLATVTTTAPHGLVAGNVVKVAAVTAVAINGIFTITSVTSTTFSYNTVTSGTIASATDTGSAYAQTSAGWTITFGQRTATTSTDYTIWYKNGVLYVYYVGNLVYANDVANSVVVDTADISISGLTPSAGMSLGSGSTGSLNASITLTAAAALSPTTSQGPAVLTAANTGLGLTGRQTYIALAKALELLSIFPVDQVYCPNVILDGPNVAFYVASDSTTAVNNPVANPDALDWLLTTSDVFGNKTYQWASETTDSNGATVAAMTAVTPATRIAAGFYEVNPAYALAKFAQAQEATIGACLAFIGTTSPTSFRLSDVRTWVGYLPTYDLITPTKVNAPGRGLLGNPYLAGTTSAKLNSLCADYAKGYRSNGFFLTLEGQYDGTVQFDKNGNPIDIGAYLHCMADIAVLSNGYATNYATNLAGYAAGFTSNLDEKKNLTNKPVNVVQLWKANQAQLDSLFQVGINVLRYKGANQLPSFLHGETLATAASDFQNLLRQRIKSLVVRVIRNVADGFIGNGSTDGLQLQALQTALTASLTELKKRGYLSKFSFTVFTSPADQRLGHASIDINFHPADELIQLNATVGLSQ